jgi:hypothetical protein
LVEVFGWSCVTILQRWRSRSTAYEQGAADRMVSPQQQAAFARKAHRFRVLARLAEKNEQAATSKQKPR